MLEQLRFLSKVPLVWHNISLKLTDSLTQIMSPESSWKTIIPVFTTNSQSGTYFYSKWVWALSEFAWEKNLYFQKFWQKVITVSAWLKTRYLSHWVSWFYRKLGPQAFSQNLGQNDNEQKIEHKCTLNLSDFSNYFHVLNSNLGWLNSRCMHSIVRQ